MNKPKSDVPLKYFYAYPSYPLEIGQTIEEAILKINDRKHPDITSWRALDIVGHFISEAVLENIDAADIFIADVTYLNFNVSYELGYAIGRKKKVLLTKNKCFTESSPTIREVGIFDTLGYEEYQNSLELASYIKNEHKLKSLDISAQLNTKAPVFLVDTKHKTDWAIRIVARIKKAGFIFRSFDPTETPRMSASNAIKDVSQSYGVVVPLISSAHEGCDVHNMRAAFVAGLGCGMRKPVCILQNGDQPVPIDYRDFAIATQHPNEINDHIAEFAIKVTQAFQEIDSTKNDSKLGLLQSLDIGATSAENEMRTLSNYYLKTDQFLKSIRGEAHLIVGRKGSGKSAIFLQVRDQERNKSGNIVLDLKPEGYKLIKFKELILTYLEEGTFQHTIMAFWEYVLLLEICYKILEKDKERHLRDHALYDSYRELSELYHADGYSTTGDFSERLSVLMEKISTSYKSKYGDTTSVRLSTPEITQLLYSHDVKKLLDKIVSYMKHKNTLWLLFDNIDKGWPTSGLTREDLIIIRTLIDASRKLEQHFDKYSLNVNTIVFLRNDVYELLVRETSDRGKEANILLDWTDPDLLRELIRLRIISNSTIENESFDKIWSKICVSHYRGEESSQYLIERSLMRPRFLLNLVKQCLSCAINLNHPIIEENDIEKGLAMYATDLLTDIDYEFRDIAPDSNNILYAFIESTSKLTKDSAQLLLIDHGVSEENLDTYFNLLIWYCFLGIVDSSDETKYIYDFNYDMKLFDGLMKRHDNNLVLSINPAFWPALMIDNNKQGKLL